MKIKVRQTKRKPTPVQQTLTYPEKVPGSKEPARRVHPEWPHRRSGPRSLPCMAGRTSFWQRRWSEQVQALSGARRRTVDRGKAECKLNKLGSALPFTLSCLHPGERSPLLVASSPLEQNRVVPSGSQDLQLLPNQAGKHHSCKLVLCVPPPTSHGWPSAGEGRGGHPLGQNTPSAHWPLESTATFHWPPL